MAEPRKIKTRVINKHAQAAVWKNTSFTPLEAEIIVYDKDAEHSQARLKVGDGSKNVNELPFITAGTADQLTTPRKISIVGDISGSTTFDGSADVSIAAELTGTFESSFTGQESTHKHTFTGDIINVSIPYTPTGSVSGEYTPAGSISAPEINVSTGTKTLDVVTNPGTQATYTQGSCVFPILQGNLTGKQLTLSVDGGKYTPGVYEQGAAPSITSITYVDSVSADATAPIFTGTKATVVSTFSGDAINLNTSITPEGEISETTITPEGQITTNYKN